MDRKVSVITPVYIEIKTLKLNIRRIQKTLRNTPHEIMIVDDNSPDGSGGVADFLAEAYPNIKVLHGGSEMGLGTAYKEGYGLCSGDYIVSMDSDLSHDPRYIPDMLKTAEEADLVIGSRLIDGGRIEGWSFWRDSLSVVTNGVIRLVISKEIFDWTSGLRVYRRALREVVMPEVHCDKLDFQFKSLYKTVERGHRVCEVPITFYEKVDGESKFSLREGLVFLGSFIRIVFKLK